jgi:uncharacterized membrane protein
MIINYNDESNKKPIFDAGLTRKCSMIRGIVSLICIYAPVIPLFSSSLLLS